MPGLIKIGHTFRDPRVRCKELYGSSGCPTPFDLVAFAQVADPAACERSIHYQLSPFRHNSQREFFRCRSGNWAALALMTHPAARIVGTDPARLYELATTSWFSFGAWDAEDALHVDPPFAHPDIELEIAGAPRGISWPILDRAKFRPRNADEADVE